MKKERSMVIEEDIIMKSRNRSGMRKRMIALVNRADDRQLMKLYEYAHRMMRDGAE